MLPSTSKLNFKKPGDFYAGFKEDILDIDPSSSTTFIYNPNASLSYEQQRQRLPIFKTRNHILYLLEKYQVLVLVGETGCGKSTQVPQFFIKQIRRSSKAGNGVTKNSARISPSYDMDLTFSL